MRDPYLELTVCILVSLGMYPPLQSLCFLICKVEIRWYLLIGLGEEFNEKLVKCLQFAWCTVGAV